MVNVRYEFKDFCEVADEIEEISSNNKIRDNLSSLMLDASNKNLEDLEVATRFITGNIYQEWNNEKKIGMGPSLVYQSISLFSDEDENDIEEMVVEEGDTGIVAEKLLSEKVQKGLGSFSKKENCSTSLSMSEIFEKLDEMSGFSGKGSQEKKIQSLSNLLSDVSPLEAKYICRLILDEMRIGVGQGTVRKSISKAFNIDEDLVKMKMMYINDMGRVARIAADGGEEELKDIDMEIGIPVDPMLAKKTTIDDTFEDIKHDEDDIIIQYKYDGARLQIHKDGDEVKLFTRNFEDKTETFPEVVEQVKDKVKEEKVILDSEVVAYYKKEDSSKPAPFKEVSTRLQRKYDIEDKMEEVEMKAKVFDIIYYDGESIIDEPLEDRISKLDKICPDIKTQSYKLSSESEIKNKETNSLSDGHEGLMAKSIKSKYRPGNRGNRWLKIKPKIETLDLVVTGGEWGEGRRSDFIGSYELSVKEGNELKEIGKVATGITDEKLEKLTEGFKSIIKSQDGKKIEFKPEKVFEVGYDEIQESPKYSSGYALRFPRFIQVREDKKVDDADTLKRVKNIKQKQN